MDNARTCTNWGLAVLAILLSPIIVIFTVPLAIGVGFDILDTVGEAPLAIALFAPVAFVLGARFVAAARAAPPRSGVVAPATAA